MAVAYQMEWLDKGCLVVSWQGVRRDESLNRKNAKKFERLASGVYAFRPLVEWTAEQVFNYHKQHGIEPNPLYKMGMRRVGCMPCINVGKEELRQIAARFPEEIERIAEYEKLVGMASKRGFSTLKGDKDPRKNRNEVFATLNINSRVKWAKTTHGGKQYSLFSTIDPPACSSAYGLCE